MRSVIPVSSIAPFSADGRLYHAFCHFVAAACGELLLVPDGGVTPWGVVPGCPVPVEEVAAVLDQPLCDPVAVDVRASPEFCRLAAIAADGWLLDRISVLPGMREPRSILRLTHPCGARHAMVWPRPRGCA